jgi:hypothetical protein
VIDDPVERRRLHEATGADVVDMESGVLARTGRLRGAVRAISDTPGRPLGRLAEAVSPDGRVAWPGLIRALVLSPLTTVHAIADARRALNALHRSARG